MQDQGQEDTEGDGGVGVSRQQLVEYIKKQKAKIKRLSEENQKLLADSQNSNSSIAQDLADSANLEVASKVDDGVSWAIIRTRSSWEQSLARCALHGLIRNLDRLNRQCTREAFCLWKRQTHDIQDDSIAELEQLKDQNKVLESKTTKLKNLLVKAQAANHRASEEREQLRRALENMNVTLREYEQRDEENRKLKEEQAKLVTLHSQMYEEYETALQRAADSTVHTLTQSLSAALTQEKEARSKTLSEIQQLKAALDSATVELEIVKTKALDLEAKLHATLEQNRTMLTEKLELEQMLKSEHSRLDEEKAARRDLEVELQALMAHITIKNKEHQSVMPIDIEATVQARLVEQNRIISEQAQTINSKEEELSVARRDVLVMRRSVEEFQRLRDTNSHLQEVIRELKRSSSAQGITDLVATQGEVESRNSHIQELGGYCAELLEVAKHHSEQESILQCKEFLLSTQLKASRFLHIIPVLSSSIVTMLRGMVENQTEAEQLAKFESSSVPNTEPPSTLKLASHEPVNWESPRIDVSPGRSISFPLPIPQQLESMNNPRTVFRNVLLKWEVHVLNGEAMAGKTQITLLVSKTSNDHASNHSGSYSREDDEEDAHTQVHLRSAISHGMGDDTQNTRLVLKGERFLSSQYSYVVSIENQALFSHLHLAYKFTMLHDEAIMSETQTRYSPQRSTFSPGRFSSVDLGSNREEVESLARCFDTLSVRWKLCKSHYHKILMQLAKTQRRMVEQTSVHFHEQRSERLQSLVNAFLTTTPTGTRPQRFAYSRSRSEEPSTPTMPSTVQLGQVSYSAEALNVRAGEDFRVSVHIDKAGTKISWRLCVSPAETDIGLCVSHRQPDGSLPLVVPYKRCSGTVACPAIGETYVTSTGLYVFVFDNSHSWFTPKTLTYQIVVTEPFIQPYDANTTTATPRESLTGLTFENEPERVVEEKRQETDANEVGNGRRRLSSECLSSSSGEVISQVGVVWRDILYQQPPSRMLMEALDMNLAEAETIAVSLDACHSHALSIWARLAPRTVT